MSLNGQQQPIIDLFHDRITKVEKDKDNLTAKLNELSTAIQVIDTKLESFISVMDKVDQLLQDVAEIKYHYGSIRRNLKIVFGFVCAALTGIITRLFSLIHLIKH